MTQKEEIKKAVSEWKQDLKNKTRYNTLRDRMVQDIISHPTPKWGGFKLSIINW